MASHEDIWWLTLIGFRDKRVHSDPDQEETQWEHLGVQEEAKTFTKWSTWDQCEDQT